MTLNHLEILRDGSLPDDLDPDAAVLSFGELCRELRSPRAWKHLFRYRSVRLHTPHLPALRRPFLTTLLIRLLGRGDCWLVDESGGERSVTPAYLARSLGRMMGDLASNRRTLRRLEQKVKELSAHSQGHPLSPEAHSQSPIYLRTDLIFGTCAGGSVSHMAGVLNNLEATFGPPIFFTTDLIPTVSPSIPTHLIRPAARFWDFPQLPALVFSDRFTRRVQRCLGHRRPAFIYQRYGLNNYSGVELAQHYQVPLVLEYNGSEIWINRHWGNRPSLKYERLGEQIEKLNLHAADLIVVVSQVLKDELIVAGLREEKILVNPNGVDVDRYSPTVDGSSVRQRHGLVGRMVLGFIGTFGPWHGPEVLVEAVGQLLRERPGDRERLRLLLIGDGANLPLVRQRILEHGLEDVSICTGLIPQQEGPAHLAACDILAAPHVPNPDGTPFFGSPTKLFEYLAMGKAIVASELGQIGEVLEHHRTAWLVRPGCSASLTAGLKVLLDDAELRARLGAAARQAAVERHSWRRHTEQIIQALQERCAPRGRTPSS